MRIELACLVPLGIGFGIERSVELTSICLYNSPILRTVLENREKKPFIGQFKDEMQRGLMKQRIL
ncbi:hypothetical protein V2H45_25170, partial [Tumidithrix elongata RA019]|nr:hypothetical protein [Tumidithrix elongata RA019]